VNKARLLERIAELVRNKAIDGISDLRDESDKDGMRVVIELKRGEVAEVVLNNLFAQTPLETVFGINMVALIDGQPKLLGLKEMLEAFLRHRREIVTRRTIFDLRKARDRAHILEGLAVALANIDEVIALIKASPTPPEAKAALVAKNWNSGVVPELLARAGAISTRPQGLAADLGITGAGGSAYKLSDIQAQAILDMRLHRLTGLEQDKIVAEYQELLALIVDLSDILARPERLAQVVREELIAIREQYGDARRTEINRDHLDLSTEDLIEPQDVVVTLSHAGYAKSQPVTEYQVQRRGGRGKAATAVKDEDFVEKLFVAHTHDTICASRIAARSTGSACSNYRRRPRLARQADGQPACRSKRARRSTRAAHQAVRRRSFRVHGHEPGHGQEDAAVGVLAAARQRHHRRGLDDERPPRRRRRSPMARASHPLVERWQVRSASTREKCEPMGREATGVRGIKLAEGQELISLIVVGRRLILTPRPMATANSRRSRTSRRNGRGGQGVIALQTTERNGEMVAGAAGQFRA
jgi:DNA gyrase subunit A